MLLSVEGEEEEVQFLLQQKEFFPLLALGRIGPYLDLTERWRNAEYQLMEVLFFQMLKQEGV